MPSSTTTVTDPYTGKETTITNPGHRVENYHLTVTIKKRSFTPYTDADGHTCNLYFNVQVKGHFEETWKEFAAYYPSQPISQSTQGDTEVTRIFADQSNWGFLTNLSSGAQLDFRVEAYTGYWHDPMPWLSIREPWVERVESSGWSNIQTITMIYEFPYSSLPSQTTALPENTITSDNNQTTHTGFLLGIIALLLCVIVALMILFFRRQLKTPT